MGLGIMIMMSIPLTFLIIGIVLTVSTIRTIKKNSDSNKKYGSIVLLIFAIILTIISLISTIYIGYSIISNALLLLFNPSKL